MQHLSVIAAIVVTLGAVHAYQLNNDQNIHELSQSLAKWCQVSGRCSFGEDGAIQKRGVGAVNDLCQLYRLKCKRSAQPATWPQESNDRGVQKSRSSSSFTDMCKKYGIKCKRDETDEGDELYWSTVRNFLALCKREQFCDFNQFVAEVAERVEQVLMKEIDVELKPRELMRREDSNSASVQVE